MKTKQVRDVVFIAHRYIGIVVGIIAAAIAMTGSLLIIHHWIVPGKTPIKADFQEVFLFAFVPRTIQEDNRTVSRGFDDFKVKDQSYTLQTNVNGKVNTGIIKHDQDITQQVGFESFGSCCCCYRI